MTSDPPWTAAWERGALGEEMLGAALEQRRSASLAVLHDRGIPGSRANIDHLVIAPAGVFVIDAKRYTGRVERRGFFSRNGREQRLFVAGRDRSRVLRGMEPQLAAVRTTLACATRVIPVVCFVDSHWGLFGSPLQFGDVRVLWPKKLYKLLEADGELTPTDIARLKQQLATALPPA